MRHKLSIMIHIADNSLLTSGLKLYSVKEPFSCFQLNAGNVENFSSKIEEWNHLVRRIEKIPNAKSIIEKYIKLTDKDRVTIDQIISRLSEM